MSIADKIDALSQAKDDIASAIVAKGGTISGGFSTFADDISNLPTGGGGLPSEYQQVEYIESTGTQYIDTNTIIESDSRIYCIFKLNDLSLQFQRIFGITNISRATGLSVELEVNERGMFAYSFVGGVMTSPTAIYKADTSKTICDINGYINYCFANGKEKTTLTFNNPNANSDRALYIFATNRDDGGNKRCSAISLYEFRIYNGEDMVRSFIPCYRKSDGEIGMYDTVSQTFFTNAGTGTFLKGADV